MKTSDDVEKSSQEKEKTLQPDRDDYYRTLLLDNVPVLNPSKSHVSNFKDLIKFKINPINPISGLYQKLYKPDGVVWLEAHTKVILLIRETIHLIAPAIFVPYECGEYGDPEDWDLEIAICSLTESVKYWFLCKVAEQLKIKDYYSPPPDLHMVKMLGPWRERIEQLTNIDVINIKRDHHTTSKEWFIELLTIDSLFNVFDVMSIFDGILYGVG